MTPRSRETGRSSVPASEEAAAHAWTLGLSPDCEGRACCSAARVGCLVTAAPAAGDEPHGRLSWV